jgi:hypothetical protein
MLLFRGDNLDFPQEIYPGLCSHPNLAQGARFGGSGVSPVVSFASTNVHDRPDPSGRHQTRDPLH